LDAILLQNAVHNQELQHEGHEIRRFCCLCLSMKEIFQK